MKLLYLSNILITRFQKDNHLRIFFSIFLLERMKNINQAKIQINSVTKGNLSLAEQFLLFRFNKIITEEFYSNNNDNLHLDIAASIKFEKVLFNCIFDLIS